jgi:3',5'-cyclic AMP phosphodiesterase CpdA
VGRLSMAIPAVTLGTFLAALPVTSHDARASEESCSLVSMPDFLNADIGDLRQLPTWNPGDPNSTNDRYRTSLSRILGSVAAERPDSVLVAGDLVEGHWGADVDGTRLFGKVRTRAQRLAQIRRAGAFYYGEWLERFQARGLQVLPAIGDHEIGDNPWKGSQNPYGAGNDFKRDALPVFKETWAKVFTRTEEGHRYPERPVGTPFEDTAYAVEPCPGVLVVTVDVFLRSGGDVHARIGGAQLAWLDRVLSESTAETKIVQGHTPVIGPVRSEHSSALMYEGGSDSAFWQTLKEHGVDLYLCGEVHTVTLVQGRAVSLDVPTTMRTGGVTQISHGGLINWGDVNYLTLDIGDGIDLELHRFHATASGKKPPTLWATTDKRPSANVRYEPGTTVTGTMRLATEGITSVTGELGIS